MKIACIDGISAAEVESELGDDEEFLPELMPRAMLRTIDPDDQYLTADTHLVHGDRRNGASDSVLATSGVIGLVSQTNTRGKSIWEKMLLFRLCLRRR